MLRLSSILSLSSLLVVGCSSSATDAPTADTGGGSIDSGSADGKLDDAVDVAVDAEVGCGNPPYITLTGVVSESTLTGRKPAPDAEVTSPLCPGLKFASGSDGSISIRLQRGAPIYAMLNVAGAIPTGLAEMQLDADFELDGVFAYSNDFLVSFPDLATKGYVAVFFSADKTAIGACADAADIVYGLAEDPAADVGYYDPSGARVAGATKSISGGQVLIAASPRDSLVHVTATKAGCTYAPPYPNTGRAKIDEGAVTILTFVGK